MNLFEVAAKLSLDDKEFNKGIDNAEKSGKNLGESLQNAFDKVKKVAAVAISGAAIKKGIDMVKELVSEVAAAGDKIDKQSQALGLSRKAYQEWDYILGQNGASIDSMGASMKTLNNLVLSAAEGSEEAKDTFSKLGLSIHEIENMEPEKQFEEVVRAFQRMPAGAEKSALAVKMFGRNGMQLLPLLNQADTSIDELRQRAEDLGLIMSDDAVDAAVVYGDSLDDLNRTFTAFKYSIGAKILPVLTTGIQKVTNYAGKLRKAYDSKGFKGVWDTLVSDFKNIKWPTWSDIKNAAIKAWETIQEGAKNLAGLVFGKKEDGSVAWPTWEDVKKKAGEIWESIKAGALAIADTLGGLVFGRAEDGTVAWPDIEQLVKDFDKWWTETALPALQGAMKWALTLFGMPEEKAEEISKVIGDWWDTIVSTAESVLQWALHLPDNPHEAGEQLGKIVGEWWEGVKSYAEGVLKWVLGLFSIGDSEGTDTKAMISDWWDQKVVPLLTNALNFTLGLFGLPPVEDMATNIGRWWGEVTDKVKQVALSVTATVSEWITTIKSWLDGTGITQIALDFGATVADWISTIKSWLDGTGVTSFTIQIGATVSGWIQTIADWIKNGINITANFLGLGGGSGSDGEDTWPEGEGNSMGVGSHRFAKGLNTVPYDDYVARLHRGEMVLTASQARRYKEGSSGGVDIAGLAQAVVGAIREGMNGASVNSYLDGRAVTGGISRRQMTQIKARRFAVS